MDELKKAFIFLALLFGLMVFGLVIIKLSDVLTPFLIACFLAYLFNPLINKISSITFKGKHLPRTIGVLLVFIMVIALMAILALAVTPILMNQLALLVTKIADWLTDFQKDWLPLLAERFHLDLRQFNLEQGKNLLLAHGQQISATMGSLSIILLHSGAGLMKFVLQLGITLVVLFYLLRDWPRLIRQMQANLLQYNFGPTIVKITEKCDRVLSVFLRGQLTVMVALAVIYTIGLTLIGMDYAILLGSITGILSIVPYLGGIVGLTLSLLAGYMQFHDWTVIAMILGVFGVGQALEGMVLTPNLVGDKLGLHPVMVIFAVMAGGELFGFFGVLLALPVAAVMLVLLKNGYRPRRIGEEP